MNYNNDYGVQTVMSPDHYINTLADDAWWLMTPLAPFTNMV